MKIKKLAFSIGLLVVYILVVNFIASIDLSGSLIDGEDSSSLGDTIKLGVSDSISVSVVRNRFYGVYHISNGDNYLYLFWLIKIPIEVKGFSFIWIHLIFAVLCGITWWLSSGESSPKRNKEKSYYEYESLL